MSSEPVPPIRKGHLGLIVAASMFGGLILALVLTLLVFGGATEPIISGVASLAFALGWTLLAWLSDRRTDQPQTVGIRAGDLHGCPRPGPLGHPAE
jgi:hypothetical protein